MSGKVGWVQKLLQDIPYFIPYCLNHQLHLVWNWFCKSPWSRAANGSSRAAGRDYCTKLPVPCKPCVQSALIVESNKKASAERGHWLLDRFVASAKEQTSLWWGIYKSVGESHGYCRSTAEIHDPKAKMHSKQEYGWLLDVEKTGQRVDDSHRDFRLS